MPSGCSSNDVKDCYGALGVVHAIWRPIPGQFDDYIAMPKANLYQSLHTAVIGPDAKPLEVQIRTRQMHEVAEAGIAAHWRYKEGSRADRRYDEKLAWVRQLMEWQREVSDATEFVEGLKLDVFQDQVFVFTPKGDVKDLPAGATPLDFAYRIHTDVGHRTIGAKVNNRLVPLDYRLRNGDIVEIVTTKASHGPSRDWLAIVQTNQAREKIRQWFKRQQRDENIAQGRELLDRELRRLAHETLAIGRRRAPDRDRDPAPLPRAGRLLRRDRLRRGQPGRGRQPARASTTTWRSACPRSPRRPRRARPASGSRASATCSSGSRTAAARSPATRSPATSPGAKA